MLIMYETEWTGIGYSLIQGTGIKKNCLQALHKATNKEPLNWDISDLTLYYIGSHKGSRVVITLE
jgi:hypothetical protein